MKDTQSKEDIQKRLKEIEDEMLKPDFWSNKDVAQATIQEMQDLKDALEGVGKYDKGDAIMTILAGAGGDDAEDFARILVNMYIKFIENRGWVWNTVHSNENDNGGYRNITLEVSGKNVYGSLKHENGVHRLVRLSPFNANQKRHTSFALVEVIPVLTDLPEIELKPEDLKIELSRSSGPGGQNVNKRETAVRIVHEPTGLSAQADGQRTQEANKEKALQLLRGKLFTELEKAREENIDALKISKSTQIEWGNQIRSYVFHPYKMVKDHRTNHEVRDIEKVVERGELDEFIEAQKEKSE